MTIFFFLVRPELDLFLASPVYSTTGVFLDFSNLCFASSGDSAGAASITALLLY